MKAATMQSSELRDELHALKRDIARALNATNERIIGASKSSVDELAEQIKTTLTDLGQVLSQEEQQVENLIADRPIAALASAFALGVVVGVMLRRR
jgi:ElaB/YqjD/DUF883 family membrane-anchored ribosome-binding protein